MDAGMHGPGGGGVVPGRSAPLVQCVCVWCTTQFKQPSLSNLCHTCTPYTVSDEVHIVVVKHPYPNTLDSNLCQPLPATPLQFLVQQVPVVLLLHDGVGADT